MTTMNEPETQAVRQRYARRQAAVEPNRYSPLRPDVWHGAHERQGAMLRLFAKLGLESFEDTKLTEVGCGAGGNLLEFLRLGVQPQNLIGIELLEDRVARADRVLPRGIVRLGDAASADIPPGSQDIVLQSTVFSSLLDDAFQERLAAAMWSWVRSGAGTARPGGGVLWYDFVYNNPRNPDVRGVTVKRIRELFPEGRVTVKRVTLAPPIARRACRVHPCLYSLFNAVPLLRTHVLCWIQKD